MDLEGFYRGDTVKIEIEIIDDNNQPINITNASVYFTIKMYYNDTDDQAIITKKVDIHTDPVNGKTEITLLPSETNNIDKGIYFYDVQLVFSDNEVYTIESGKIKIEPDITRRID